MIGVQDKRELTNLVSQLSDRNSIILAIHASVSTRVQLSSHKQEDEVDFVFRSGSQLERLRYMFLFSIL